MRTISVLLLLSGLGTLAACSRSAPVDIANNDSAALVAAIRQANARPGHDTIRLARNGLYILGNPAEPGLLLPPIGGELTIEGNHAEVRGYSDKPAAILEAVDSEIAYNLLLANRRDAGTVLNYGDLELERSRIHDNRAVGRQRTLAAAGGILNFGSVKADGLVLADNELASEDAPLLSFGGILNLGNGKVSGTTPAEAVRDARHAAVFTGI